MAKRILLRRGTTNQTNAFTGGLGEVTVDTDKDVLVVHDGSTAGGFPVAARANNDTTVSIISKTGKILATIPYAGLLDNTLTSTATDQALTTAQGKVLKDLVDTKLASTANAVSATKLVTARTINGVSFDGTANISVPALVTGISTNGVNLNSFTTAGFYACSTNAVAATLVNTPTSSAFGMLVVTSAGCYQELTEYMSTGTPKTYKRHFYNGTWGSWYEILTTLNPDDTKLPLAGGTLTGALNGTTAVFSGSVQVGNGIQSDNPVSFLTGGLAQKINTGGVLVSNSYADASLVPTYGIYSKGIVHSAVGYRTIDDRDAKPNVLTGGTFAHYFTSMGGMTGASDLVWADMVVLNGYTDSSGGSINALVMPKQSANIYHYQAAQGATTWGTPRRLAYDTDNVASASKLSTASGSAPSYSARAWVNFNGTGTVAIRASGNVSSITDNGTGNYTVNFTTAMPHANYSLVGATTRDDAVINSYNYSLSPYAYTTSSVSVYASDDTAGATDVLFVNCVVFC